MSDDPTPIEKFVGGIERHSTRLIDWYDLDPTDAATELRNLADRIERDRDQYR